MAGGATGGAAAGGAAEEKVIGALVAAADDGGEAKVEEAEAAAFLTTAGAEEAAAVEAEVSLRASRNMALKSDSWMAAARTEGRQDEEEEEEEEEERGGHRRAVVAVVERALAIGGSCGVGFWGVSIRLVSNLSHSRTANCDISRGLLRAAKGERRAGRAAGGRRERKTGDQMQAKLKKTNEKRRRLFSGFSLLSPAWQGFDSSIAKEHATCAH